MPLEWPPLRHRLLDSENRVLASLTFEKDVTFASSMTSFWTPHSAIAFSPERHRSLCSCSLVSPAQNPQQPFDSRRSNATISEGGVRTGATATRGLRCHRSSPRKHSNGPLCRRRDHEPTRRTSVRQEQPLRRPSEELTKSGLPTTPGSRTDAAGGNRSTARDLELEPVKTAEESLGPNPKEGQALDKRVFQDGGPRFEPLMRRWKARLLPLEVPSWPTRNFELRRGTGSEASHRRTSSDVTLTMDGTLDIKRHRVAVIGAQTVREFGRVQGTVRRDCLPHV